MSSLSSANAGSAVLRAFTGVLAVAEDLDELQLVADELVPPESPGDDTVPNVEDASAPTRPNGLEESEVSLPLILILLE